MGLSGGIVKFIVKCLVIYFLLMLLNWSLYKFVY